MKCLKSLIDIQFLIRDRSQKREKPYFVSFETFEDLYILNLYISDVLALITVYIIYG